MPYFTAPLDGTRLFYRYNEPSDIAFKPRSVAVSKLTLVFLHGWPMSSSMFDHLMVPLCETYRFRCVALDRRGFGKSDWNNGPRSSPVTMQTFVRDTVALLEHLELQEVVLIGASMGTTESVQAYETSPFIKERCKGLIMMGTNMPYPTQCPESPLSPTVELWDSIIQGLRDNKPEYVTASMPGIFALAAGNELGPKTVEAVEQWVAAADPIALEKTAMINLGTSAIIALRQLAVGGAKLPILLLHGDTDQGMPLEASALLVKEVVPWAEVKVYEKAGHGLYLTHSSQVINDILGFVEGISKSQS